MESEHSNSPNRGRQDDRGDMSKTYGSNSSGMYHGSSNPGYSSVPLAPGCFTPFQAGQTEKLSYLLGLNCGTFKHLMDDLAKGLSEEEGQEENNHYYQEYCRLFIANVVLTTQVAKPFWVGFIPGKDQRDDRRKKCAFGKSSPNRSRIFYTKIAFLESQPRFRQCKELRSRKEAEKPKKGSRD